MKTLVTIGAVVSAAFLIGLLIFVTRVPGPPGAWPEPADAIVVLTGGQNRLSRGMDLLSQRKGRRLLISGVHRDTTRDDLRRQLDDPGNRFTCCVDLDHAALSTRGNAQETAAWAQANGFRSLIVVTAHYHMPRSLLEFRRAMPEITLVADPVFPDGVEVRSWWSDLRAGRIVLGEYLKYLASLAYLSV